MRSGVISAGPLTQANPLRISTSNNSPEKPVFVPPETENKIFGAIKATKKPVEEVEKVEVSYTVQYVER